MEIINKTKLSLPYQLTAQERESMGMRIAQLLEEKEIAIAERKSVMKGYKDREDYLDSVIALSGTELRSGIQYRSTPVIIVAVGSGEVEVIREDTMEVVRRRPMTDEERERKLFNDDRNRDMAEVREMPEEGTDVKEMPSGTVVSWVSPPGVREGTA